MKKKGEVKNTWFQKNCQPWNGGLSKLLKHLQRQNLRNLRDSPIKNLTGLSISTRLVNVCLLLPKGEKLPVFHISTSRVETYTL